MIKAVVFDLDDTLISEKQYVLSGFRTVARKISTDFFITQQEVLEKMNQIFTTSSKMLFNKTLDELKIKYDIKYIDELITTYRKHNPIIDLYDDVIPIIKYLKQTGLKLGIITDGYKETQTRKIDAIKIKDYFNYIIITDELGKDFWKPSEKPYKLMSEKLGVNFNEIIYVGDNVEKDFITANRLGVLTVLIKREDGIYIDTVKDELYYAKYNINTLIDLKRIINKDKQIQS
ncbi:haloacid dehalogenase [Clostridium polyendosporum]|uniref:Haloacid dehalogenase n=1 Tax=Clostridium polyendosporum TaxID=69208 RepID=A0A919VGL5_9CLOT|nr:HAD-IA family hydrolase [Clostridium polyendosporum]GIM28756.1 haloacid dehalogenase [Clostridium polyendosporum]